MKRTSLIKPFTKDEFLNAFSNGLEMSKQISEKPKNLRIEQRQFVFEYELNSIAYIESFGKQLHIHTCINNKLNEDSISGYSLARILEMLKDDNFIQCHKKLYNKQKLQSKTG